MEITDAAYQPRRATRSSADRILGGVAAGLGAHLGLPALWVRLAFIAFTLVGGLGVAMYAGLWMILPTDTRFEDDAPGIAAASRQGKRPGHSTSWSDGGQLVALGAIALGAVVLIQVALGNAFVFWPLLLAGIGVAVLWRQADEAQQERWRNSSGRLSPLRAVLGSGGPAAYARLVAGVVLLGSAMILFALGTGQATVARDVLLAAGLGVAGLAVTLGPWLFRLSSDLTSERAERIRSQERADLAAHLHDSVLQTLALIQKHAGDQRTVSTLARAQERDLRAWLYTDHVPDESTVAAALRAAAAEVEDGHGVPVEVVTVGDVPASDQAWPVVLASREAMVNAAKHSGADQVDVYAEITDTRLEVFVRDRGRGFDKDEVPADRLGVRNSIVDRLHRHGGDAEVRTAPGEGTEVRLSMTLTPEGSDR